MSRVEKKPYSIPAYRLRLERTGSVISDYRYCSDALVVYDVFGMAVGDADREHLVAFYLDAQCRFIGFEVVAIGSLDRVVVHPREIYKGAILANAHSIVVAHNHPSGEPGPSPEDLLIASNLHSAGAILKIPLRDMVIVGHQNYCSFLTRGLLPRSLPGEADEPERKKSAKRRKHARKD